MRRPRLPDDSRHHKPAGSGSGYRQSPVFFSQVREMGIDCAVIHFGLIGQCIQNLFPGDNLPAPSDQKAENFKFSASQRKFGIFHPYHPFRPVDADVPIRQPGVSVGLSFHHPVHSGRQFIEAEGFPDIIIRPHGQSPNGGRLIRTSRHHQNRYDAVLFTKTPAEFESGPVGKLDVQEDHVVFSFRQAFPSVRQGSDRINLISPVGEAHDKSLGNDRIVLDQQHMLHSSTLPEIRGDVKKVHSAFNSGFAGPETSRPCCWRNQEPPDGRISRDPFPAKNGRPLQSLLRSDAPEHEPWNCWRVASDKDVLLKEPCV